MRDIVKKDNALTGASYTLTLGEQRLILLAVAEAAGQADALRSMSVHASEYAERFGVTRQAAYMALHEASAQLFERRFSYQQINKRGNLEKVVSRWVQSVKYVEAEARLQLRFADDVIPLLTDLKNRFTHYALEQISGLTSVHAVRLYELLIAWRSKRQTPAFEVGEFRQKLGIGENEYPRMDNFKRRVLDAAIDQINQHTDITATYEQHKKGRSITGFSFTFTMKSPPARDPNTIDWVDGKTDAEATADKPRRTTISRREAEAMARPGESYSELYARLNREYVIK